LSSKHSSVEALPGKLDIFSDLLPKLVSSRALSFEQQQQQQQQQMTISFTMKLDAACGKFHSSYSDARLGTY
jgi:hypothetical protein